MLNMTCFDINTFQKRNIKGISLLFHKKVFELELIKIF